MTQSGKLLIFIVAYNAEHHIDKVLKRIPESVFRNYEYEILIIDDSSKDNTFEVAHKYHETNEALNLKILYNPTNQGYGGNQKLGYEYAVKNGFDVVILLHGDGQYAPEIMEDLIKPIFGGEADAVFGSRMLNKGGARKGGMPLYKFVGNKILTGFQNYMLKTNLSEFHSGYRAYSVKSLGEIPFKRNSNDFHFDTQIIIQFVLAKKRINEVPIPTYYGTEICHVNGMKYGWDVIKATWFSKLHQLSIFYKREYDVSKPATEYSLKLGYLSSHTLAIKNVAANSRVLDIGGGQGRLAAELRKKGCYVAGIDMYELADESGYDEFYLQNLDNFKIDFDMKQFDHVLMLDIIEHLSNPEEFLDKLRAGLGLNCPKIIVTTPNIAFFINRFQLLFGQFNYGKEGILDKTHKRLFTFKTLKRLFKQCGFTIERVKGIPAPFPKATRSKFIGKTLLAINQGLMGLFRNLFSYQIYIEVKPLPVVEALLENTLKESEIKKAKLSKA
jgi:glycosyltransferase involved in cell wall biosynthesis